MPALDRLNVGLVGAAGRGGNFRAAFEANGARILAVCDIRADELDEAAERLGAAEKYADYAEMIEKCDLDAVVIGTPMPLHVPQSILALRNKIHVLSEVPAGVSIEECQALVKACAESDALYMMAENYTYIKPNVVVKELVRQGLFGEVYYAEGEYLHELKERNELTPWRRKWQTGDDGITYGTHALGPILQWMPGDRVVRVCCEGSGRRHRDPRGESYHQDTAVMLCKTAKGALIKIRVDMVSDRPHAMRNYQLQGTAGVYESSRAGGVEGGKIWLRTFGDELKWHDLDSLMNACEFAERYVPEIRRHPPEESVKSGHAGGDFFEVRDFVRAIRGEAPCPIGIHEAMDMTLPGLVSQRSIGQGGAWLDVPDSRTWQSGAPREQLQMIWPEGLLDSPPVANVPEGYRLRGYRPEDKNAHFELMDRVGLKGWDESRLRSVLAMALPEGFLIIEHKATGAVVASAVALHKPDELHPFGAELGWVGADPAHAGKGLGTAVSAAATARILRAGYRSIHLHTDDFRLPAIKIYLKLGYEPFLFTDDMRPRWESVYRTLGRKLPDAIRVRD